VKTYSTIADGYHSGFASLAKDIPGPMAGFQDLMVAAIKDGALSTKTKELIAFAIGITVRCDGCLAHHSQAVLKAGATREEVAEMIGVTLLMGGGPSSVYGVEAMRAYDEFAEKSAAAAE
jgi:AhpD family alkylhydroperoxidase